MDKVLRRAQWLMFGLMAAFIIAHLNVAAWVAFAALMAINVYWAVRVVALVVGHRRERKAANAAAHARMLRRRNGEVA